MDSWTIILELRKDNYVEKIASQFCGKEYSQYYYEDMIAELWMMVYDKKDIIQSIYQEEGIDNVRKYVYGIVRHQLMSKNSKIFYRFKNQKATLELTDDFSKYEKLRDIEIVPFNDVREVLDKLSISEAYFFNTFIECDYNVKDFARVFGISEKLAKNTLIKIIMKAKKIIECMY